MTTKIEWTNETWNPIVGCSKVSPGCKNCYAERMAKRLKAMRRPQYQDVVDENGWTGKTVLSGAMQKPFTWRKLRMVFVDSMNDLFHDTVPFEWIDDVMDVIKRCPQHTFQILTKRADRMEEYFSTRPVPDNVWLMVSVENQDAADERIPHLLRIKAGVRGISMEPLLGMVDLRPYLKGLHWVIGGGETGPDARPMHTDWIRSPRDQCVESGTPFFFKQWGEWAQSKYPWMLEDGETFSRGYTFDDGMQMIHVGKKAAGHLLDGVEWRQMPEVTNA